MSRDLFVVVVAAGLGTRLGGSTRKAAVELGGVPIAVHSLRAFRSTPGAIGGVIVVHSDDLETARECWLPAAGGTFPWQIVRGGDTRADSCGRGLAAAPPEAGRFIVHDAARPLLHPEDRDAVIAALERSEGAILAAPITDTVKRVTAGRILEGVDRSELWGAQTPQAFTRAALDRARAHAPLVGTDEASWLVAAGVEVRVVAAQHPNPKITHPSDLSAWRSPDAIAPDAIAPDAGASETGAPETGAPETRD